MGSGNCLAVFGGAFDPTTLAHEFMAQSAWTAVSMPIWMMPCYAHRFGKELTAPAHRLRMVELITEGKYYLAPCDFEIRRRHNGSMFDTLTALSEEYRGVLFHLLIGMDNANVIHRWHRGEELIATFPCIVCGRLGVTPLTEWYLQPPHLFVDFKMQLSATDVREAIEAKKYRWAKDNLNPKVWDYIKEHGLYGYTEVEGNGEAERTDQ